MLVMYSLVYVNTAPAPPKRNPSTSLSLASGKGLAEAVQENGMFSFLSQTELVTTSALLSKIYFKLLK